MSGYAPSFIEAMEKSASDRCREGELPTKEVCENTKRLKELGFEIPDVPSFGMMTPVTFPPGWTSTTESDPRHIHLLDETGKKRIYVFVKDTPYDHYARMSFCD